MYVWLPGESERITTHLGTVIVAEQGLWAIVGAKLPSGPFVDIQVTCQYSSVQARGCGTGGGAFEARPTLIDLLRIQANYSSTKSWPTNQGHKPKQQYGVQNANFPPDWGRRKGLTP
ncbi:hypothetical protein NOR_08221 [Metarhizium rileyi]|uniref:Uncharacterized protein n=1 Tax=Metarhizium rileyi (strain RCEF 4871) TaxID=1649241 RepID=A0A166WQA4_METRR|nr:hypothetical protein NOR_08221 [Metarhizium rileyi RCEF 4871]